jgi:hypothetical protein
MCPPRPASWLSLALALAQGFEESEVALLLACAYPALSSIEKQRVQQQGHTDVARSTRARIGWRLSVEPHNLWPSSRSGAWHGFAPTLGPTAVH